MPEFVLPYAPIVITGTENLPRDEWLAFRKTGIGGSEAAAAFGIPHLARPEMSITTN